MDDKVEVERGTRETGINLEELVVKGKTRSRKPRPYKK